MSEEKEWVKVMNEKTELELIKEIKAMYEEQKKGIADLAYRAGYVHGKFDKYFKNYEDLERRIRDLERKVFKG